MSQQPWGAPPPPRRGAPPRPTWAAPPTWGPPGQWPAARQWPAPRPPRRRSSGLGNAVRVVVAVVAIIMIASAVKGFLERASESSSRPEQPAPAPRVPGDPTTSYVNEDYTPPPVDRNPPPVPGPRTMDAAGRLVTGNPLYDQSVPVPTNCAMAQVAVNSASPAQKQAHFNDLMGCLMTVFAEPVEAAGFTMPRPPVTVYARPIKTACGDFSEVNAAYCTGDQRIYYADNLLRAFPPAVANANYAAEMILAHEFGHAIQARTAILISEKYLEQDARTEEAALDLSRRTEVQADCLAGQYVRSVAQSQGLGSGDLDRLAGLVYNLGDDVLSGRAGYSGGHGTGEARQYWFDRGSGSDAIAACNSFTVGSDLVR
ncbi:MAG: neutral zinc metallopeptidase [Actinomycetes bacterium]